MSKRPSCLQVPQFLISLSLPLSIPSPRCVCVCPSPGKCIVIRSAKAWPQTASTTTNKPQNVLSLQQQATPTSKRDACSHDPTYHWTASAQSPVWPQVFYSFDTPASDPRTSLSLPFLPLHGHHCPDENSS